MEGNQLLIEKQWKQCEEIVLPRSTATFVLYDLSWILKIDGKIWLIKSINLVSVECDQSCILMHNLVLFNPLNQLFLYWLDTKRTIAFKYPEYM